jgi:hypothetical protein
MIVPDYIGGKHYVRTQAAYPATSPMGKVSLNDAMLDIGIGILQINSTTPFRMAIFNGKSRDQCIRFPGIDGDATAVLVPVNNGV